MNIEYEYQQYCSEHNIPFEICDSVMSYDDTTLFCPAGMQKFKTDFKNVSVCGKTVANSQSCIRLTDFALVGDGTHGCCFTMLGLFSFRDWSVEKTVDFWLKFLENRLGLNLQYITVHPTHSDWKKFYGNRLVKLDKDCVWTDGEIGGYCTEIFVNDVEIGNIVNPLKTCIDVGFGLDRLDRIINNTPSKSRVVEMIDCAVKIIDSGVMPSGKQHGYVLRRILREIWKLKGDFPHPFYKKEIERQNNCQYLYDRLKNKNLDKSNDWWYGTHGIDFEFVEK